MDHYTLTLHTPHVLPDVPNIPLHVSNTRSVLTEPWVNKQYLIDYRRDDKGRLAILFHKNKPGNRYHMRVQLYLPLEWFPALKALADGEREPDETATHDQGTASRQQPASDISEYFSSLYRSPEFLIGAGLLALLSFLLAWAKWRSLLAARRGLKDILWQDIEWTSPRLVVSDLTKKARLPRT